MSDKSKSLVDKRCPIYVHQFSNDLGDHCFNDFGIKNDQSSTNIYNYPKKNISTPSTKKIVRHKESMDTGKTKTKNRRKTFQEIEESYWSNWKPTPHKGTKQIYHKSRSKGLSNMDRDRNLNVKGEGDSADSIIEKYVSNKFKMTASSSIMQSEENVTLPKIEEVSDERVERKATKQDDDEGTTFLKHTDSYILNSKKQNDDKPHYQQPKCIRLYKNLSTTSSYIKGGSYPLKSCLKKETSFNGSRLGRPWSPILKSSSFRKSNKTKTKLSYNLYK